MAKLMLFICVALLVGGVLSASTRRVWQPPPRLGNCGHHGDPCESARPCCQGMRCQSFVNKCQVIITADDLLAQRRKMGLPDPDK